MLDTCEVGLQPVDCVCFPALSQPRAPDLGINLEPSCSDGNVVDYSSTSLIN